MNSNGIEARTVRKGSVFQVVGVLDVELISRLLGVNFAVSEVRMYPGAKKHIKNRHPGVFEKYAEQLADFIAYPDYIGQHPNEPNSVELVKMISEGVLIAIKLDATGYLYLSSMYVLQNGRHKIEKRLRMGRLKPYVRPANEG